jgi:hypothetical protein
MSFHVLQIAREQHNDSPGALSTARRQAQQKEGGHLRKRALG